MRALLVDDSRAQRCVVRGMLRELGFDVLEAANGNDAWQKLDTPQALDVAIVDWNMPEMNGLEFIKTIRASDNYQDLRIVMATTETEMTQVVTALEAGANEYVMKPFPKDALHDKLVLLGVL